MPKREKKHKIIQFSHSKRNILTFLYFSLPLPSPKLFQIPLPSLLQIHDLFSLIIFVWDVCFLPPYICLLTVLNTLLTAGGGDHCLPKLTFPGFKELFLFRTRHCRSHGALSCCLRFVTTSFTTMILAGPDP